LKKEDHERLEKAFKQHNASNAYIIWNLYCNSTYNKETKEFTMSAAQVDKAIEDAKLDFAQD
jgi:hypothetical protein